MMENSIAMFYLFFCTNETERCWLPIELPGRGPGQRQAPVRCWAQSPWTPQAGRALTHPFGSEEDTALLDSRIPLIKKKKTTRSGSAKGRQIGYDCTQISSSPLAQNNCGEEKKAEMVGTSREGRSWERRAKRQRASSAGAADRTTFLYLPGKF